MAHKKATGSNASQKGNRQGKRRGVKKFAGQVVTTGTILVRQVGTVIHAGENVKIGKDFSLFSLIDGIVGFKNISKNRKKVYVMPLESTSSK